MIKIIFSIGFGAVCGALLRWQLANQLNKFNWVPMGTLAANLLAGYIIGFAISFFAQHESLNPNLKLFIITGFCGSLSTFSSFSSEIVKALQLGQYNQSLSIIFIHVIGSVIMTFLGITSYNWLKDL